MKTHRPANPYPARSKSPGDLLPRAWGTVVAEGWKRGYPRFLVRFPNGQQFWFVAEDLEFKPAP